uniref:Uncharacterized protein n=1 Tax=Rhizophora mucronata TaxID=61149 RepID=A0A2P2P6J8_RHIMU
MMSVILYIKLMKSMNQKIMCRGKNAF